MNVLLYSAGMDSYIARHLLGKDWTCLYVDLDTRYTEKEIRAIAHQRDFIPEIAELPMGMLEQDDAFLPQRNVILMTFAQALFNADKVAIASVRGEYSRDKHNEFFKRLSKTLSYTAGKPVVCFSPLQSMTKTQALRRYLDEGYSGIRLLQETVSCYDSQSRACGKCMSCYRRWVALENNGLTQSWDSLPWEWIKENHSPLNTLRKLPPSQYVDFARAQTDAITAHLKVARRRHNVS